MHGTDYIAIPLQRRDGTVRAYAKISLEDAALTEFQWCLMSLGYVVRNLPRPQEGCLYMHRVILGLVPGDGLQADHINGDRTDCRRSNLRVVTNAQNSQNQAPKGATSRHRGVFWDRRRRAWVVNVMVDGRKYYGGKFHDEEDAAMAARALRQKMMPFTVEDR